MLVDAQAAGLVGEQVLHRGVGVSEAFAPETQAGLQVQRKPRGEPDRVYRRRFSSYSAARVTVFRLP